jgi:hypothetical protein
VDRGTESCRSDVRPIWHRLVLAARHQLRQHRHDPSDVLGSQIGVLLPGQEHALTNAIRAAFHLD